MKQNSRYQRELKKVTALLAVGVLLLVIFIIAMFSKGYMKNARLGTNDFLIFFSVLLYPIGIVYGWRKMLGLAFYHQHHEPADRYYTVIERRAFQSGNIVTRCFILSLVVCFGWIFGVYQAVKTLIYLKNESIADE